ncbi:contact-dependent growth inhibition system immunity protein [Streptomyces antibioticus]|uniref:contact-dependent growth inhibition system immunity protein n=1 Tax=Streptomyces antibioticus TaxID=1890 RepID=UPI003D71448E
MDEGRSRPRPPPPTHWEWNARFPEPGQFLGGWFSQDMPEEFGHHDAAVDDYRATADPHLVARLVGEVHELLALQPGAPGYALAVAGLGTEVDPSAPLAPSGWLTLTAARLAAPRADHGPDRTP